MNKLMVSGLVFTMSLVSTQTNVFALNRSYHLSRTDYTTTSGIVDFNQGDASITIQPNGEQTLVGKKFNVYQLFFVENAVGLESVNYTFNPKYEKVLKKVVGQKLNKEPSLVTEYEVIDYMHSLSTKEVEGSHSEQILEGSYSAYRSFAEKLRDEMVKLGISGDHVEVSDVQADGSFKIGGLAYGYYFVDEVSFTNGKHEASSLCILNTANPDAKTYIKSDFPTLIKKIQEDDDQDMIGNNGWNDMADFEIGQTVPYKFESNISNMNGYDTYYYAWHDHMDEALTFDPSSVDIQISDETKTYFLTDSEFSVILNSTSDETFKVEVLDIKAIVDREFNQMNSDGENIYGQSVLLTYHATLNDLASKDTGRPGFENDVMLEFSNNPDSDGQGQTGQTPWDTVVCFTYKLQGLKLNNHDQTLEGAKFRLYRDVDCTQEVLVKNMEDGYHVIHDDSVNDETKQEAVEMVSNAVGLFTIIGLDDGVYWLKETNSPDGYRELLDPIRLTVEATFVEDRNQYVAGQGATDQALVQLEATAYVKEFLDGLFGEKTEKLETDVENGFINLTVVNTVGKKLPITGGNTMILCLTLGTAFLSVGYVWFMKNRKHEDK